MRRMQCMRKKITGEWRLRCHHMEKLIASDLRMNEWNFACGLSAPDTVDRRFSIGVWTTAFFTPLARLHEHVHVFWANQTITSHRPIRVPEYVSRLGGQRRILLTLRSEVFITFVDFILKEIARGEETKAKEMDNWKANPRENVPLKMADRRNRSQQEKLFLDVA